MNMASINAEKSRRRLQEEIMLGLGYLIKI
jgi:hypothetical protein